MIEKSIIKKQFFNSLKRGTGEAFILMKQYPEIDFSAYIQKAIIKNYAYDGQCESSRVNYLFSFYQLAHKKEKIRDAVLEALQTEIKDTWTLTQLFEFAKILAQQGDKEAKKGIYKRFGEKIIPGSDWAGSAEILELDGFDGLKYIAETFGRLLENDPEDCQDDELIISFQEKNKSINILEKLQEEAKRNKYIRLYLESIERTNKSYEEYQKNREKPQEINNDPASIINYLLTLKRIPPYIRKRKFDDETLESIAIRFLNEENKANKEKLLSIFIEHKFPFDYHPILELAKEKYNPKNRIIEYAIESLKFFQAKDLRDFTIDKLQTARLMNINLYLPILISNYKKGDYKLLNHLINKSDNPDFIHSINRDIRKIYEQNITTECKGPLENLYNKITCSECREDIIKLLIRNNVLSNKILKEIEFDCNENIQKLFAELRNKN